MKLIAVSQRVDLISERKEVRDSIDQQLFEFIYKAGYLPLGVPNFELKANNVSKNKQIALTKWLEKISPLAVVLSGGNNIGEVPKRDATEEKLIHYALEKKLPLLGICRGMQMIAKYLGVSLQESKNHSAVRHEISGVINRQVNSYHNFIIESCPNNFSILARSNEGYIEAIKHNKLPWEGWMWHPERENIFHQNDLERLRSLFK